MNNLTLKEVMTMIKAQSKSVYRVVQEGAAQHQVMVLDEPMGGRIGPTKQALTDQGYTVDVWYVAQEEAIPDNADAIIISEPDRVWHDTDAFQMMSTFLEQTSKKVVLIPSRSRQEQRQNHYGIHVHEQGFWKWAASRFPII